MPQGRDLELATLPIRTDPSIGMRFSRQEYERLIAERDRVRGLHLIGSDPLPLQVRLAREVTNLLRLTIFEDLEVVLFQIRHQRAALIVDSAKNVDDIHVHLDGRVIGRGVLCGRMPAESRKYKNGASDGSHGPRGWNFILTRRSDILLVHL